ncbi:folic acid synthesis protein fol1 [Pneumocystis jirovecii RU7]|uniref:Folic acid synthesis protein fol1 n=2 Tax=Pneumocystis jirovecii TaxID=42068 RepID=A0A0W4ZMK4_PNEJ7|nr:folic acid synthesis protein fol1 [Pneumocystis jirovecii RU7]KTW29614.1 folic acid synthesis protein fol1 [Pneumocystis jirovecii RU7]
MRFKSINLKIVPFYQICYFKSVTRIFFGRDIHSLKLNKDYDLIHIHSLTLKSIIGKNLWAQKLLQPVFLTLSFRKNTTFLENLDDLSYSIDYTIVYKEVYKLVESSEFQDLADLADKISELVFSHKCKANWVKIKIETPKGNLFAGTGLQVVRRKDGIVEVDDQFFVKKLSLFTIIGMNPEEMINKQNIIINLILYKSPINLEDRNCSIINIYNIEKVLKEIVKHVESSSFKTIEALALSIARILCISHNIEKIKVNVEKPSALAFARSAGVEIVRSRSCFFSDDYINSKGPVDNDAIYIALGSNLGNKVKFISDAIEKMSIRGIKVLKTSMLYESEPMYFKDQPVFYNAVCKVETSLNPKQLLDELKTIEKEFGRVKTIDKGPRCIDLDIIFFRRKIINSESLIVPHPQALERPFVLKPLCDISNDLVHPITGLPIVSYLKKIVNPGIKPVLPFLYKNRSINFSSEFYKAPTHIMAILNLTPDSFFDGGVHSYDSILMDVENFINAGATIIDIGGQSARSGSHVVSIEEEISRVIPAIKYLLKVYPDILVSVDTFRSEVAEQAIKAGASLVNDISGGRYDPKMLNVVAKLKVPICIMHMRGDFLTMDNLTDYGTDIIKQITKELEELLVFAESSGIFRWNIILDPGLGFAKTSYQNIELLRRFNELKSQHCFNGLPWLLGPSRKRFTGCLTGDVMPKDRIWGTAASVAASVLGGCDIIRVHDVYEMYKVSRTLDAIWKGVY